VTVRNTGERPGREVVQIYVGPQKPDPALPERWLAGFAVVQAGPGESATVEVPLAERAFQVWEDGAWRTLEGPFNYSTRPSCSRGTGRLPSTDG
jgi:beta-glucosidase